MIVAGALGAYGAADVASSDSYSSGDVEAGLKVLGVSAALAGLGLLIIFVDHARERDK
jgi:hypothetical protein